ncbi:MAG: preprotein translocase subunit SecG [Gemmatimonadales bacterium]
MYAFLLAIMVLDGVFMAVVILLQSGKGGGLASVGGGAAMTEGILGGRQATTVLTRASWISGSAFMILALVLSIMSSRSTAPQSVIQVPAAAPATAPEPVIPGLGGTDAGTTPPPVETTTPPAGGTGN